MQDSKKAFFSAFIFLFIVLLLSLLIIEPYLQGEALYWEDSRLRDELQGKLDCLIIGASHCVHGFIPSVIDSKTNFHSYNLGGSLMTFSGRYALLKKELERNPVSTVVIELSFNSLFRDEQSEYGEGDTYVLSRLGSFNERANYLINSTRFSDLEHVYSLSLFLGMVTWERFLFGKGTHNVIDQYHGYFPAEPSDISLPTVEYLKKMNTTPLNLNPRPENLQHLAELVHLCNQYHASVIIAVVPVSNQFVWEGTRWDTFTDPLRTFCEEENCLLLDFNLLRNRYELFSDEYSFSDDIHMSNIGAEVFSTVFSEILMKSLNGEDTSSLFVDSYDAVKLLDPSYALLGHQ